MHLVIDAVEMQDEIPCTLLSVWFYVIGLIEYVKQSYMLVSGFIFSLIPYRSLFGVVLCSC